ncbi:chromogranin-A [Varanus komodoensis]|uniref:chromogranin-A n=1 Tax=Varanus komodoensis TaxID=61221 RepID=UPI001CF7CDD9|nr:chromogranin-A [Varanus komodoensis]
MELNLRIYSITGILITAPLSLAVLSLPVANPTLKDDSKVMKCIAEVISDTVSKPNPLPVSQECLDILQGDERIHSILRHQNLLKEFQQIAAQGANERTEQQKKNRGFEDELSEVLESQSNANAERELKGTPDEELAASLAKLEVEKDWKHSEIDASKEEGKNNLQEREPRAQNLDSEDGKENAVRFESNEVGEAEELPWDDTADNRIHSDVRDEEVAEQRSQEEEEAAELDEFEDEKEQVSKHSQEESREEGGDSVQEQAEEEEEEEDEDVIRDEEEEEKERSTSEEAHPTSSEDVDGEREDENQDTKESEHDEKPSEEEEKYHSAKRLRHHSSAERRQDEVTSKARDPESEEAGEESSRELEDAKRWNKMDELAKQLTTTKRVEEEESDEDPDRSMKLALRSHNPEEEERRPLNHHSKEESSERGVPLAAIPEEKKDEEGSANRKTEDQELDSLAAIEAELEKVAHKLHALRRG